MRGQGNDKLTLQLLNKKEENFSLANKAFMSPFLNRHWVHWGVITLEVASAVSLCHSQVFVSVSQLEVTVPSTESSDWIVQAFLNFQCQMGSN